MAEALDEKRGRPLRGGLWLRHSASEVTARCAATVRDRLSDAGAKARVAALYGSIIKAGIHKASSIKVAEAVALAVLPLRHIN